MAKHPQIHITVGQDGIVSADFSRFVGPECLIAGQQLRALLAEMGVQTTITSMTPKPELAASFPEPSLHVQAEDMCQEGGIGA